MQKWLKVTIGVVSSIIIIFLVGGYLFSRMLYSTLPVYEGEIESSFVKENVEIYRDSLGVPYIFADSDFDAAFALGYVHAQERLFAMDLARRAGAGRLSEIFGTRTIPFDRMFRTIGIKKTVDENIKRVSPHTLEILKAYSNGVNQYIADAGSKLPVEFDLLGYEPYKWTPEHSLIIGRMLAYELNISWWTDFAFTRLVQKLGEEKAREIIPQYDENMPVVISDAGKSISFLPVDYIRTNQKFRNFMGMNGTHIGSNNWVVNGNKSESGKSIIANDTHLSLGAPSKWYVAVIKSPEWNAAGFTIPGIPVVVIGKNNNISWAVTNIMIDDTDFYSEQIDSSGNNYLLNGTWQRLKKKKEKIGVKDSLDVSIEIVYTHHGPLIDKIHPFNVLYKDNGVKTEKISMRWLGSEQSDELQTFFKINKAGNFEQFREAFKSYSVPGQNFIYADDKNNIGYVFGGRLPVRAGNRMEYIYDGTTTSNDWQTILNVSDLPYLYNPPTNYIASANNKTLNNFKYPISNIWEPASRFERITELLNSKAKHSVNDFEHYQNDFISPYARKLTPFILSAFDDVKIRDKNLKLSLELLDKWNYEFDKLSQIPSIYIYFLKYFMKNIFLDEMGRDLFNEYVLVGNVPYRKIMDLMKNPSNSWIDNIKTKNRETLNEVIRKSFVNGLTALEKSYGKNLKDWQWGRIHTVTFEHPFSGQSSFIDRYINIGPYNIGGDGTTLFNTEYPFHESLEGVPILEHKEFECTLGPSMRYIFDFAKPDEFYIILPTGQSGNVLSEHYRDMTSSWLDGKYAVINTDEKIIQGSGMQKLIFKKIK
ncbi:MAG: penicillin acylase family protein [Ignavibacteriaceae bacterium]|nr:penicillin acylase family protein [Ignavibacteriaceae bacterium]